MSAEPARSNRKSGRSWLLGLSVAGVLGVCLCLLTAATIGGFLFIRSRQLRAAEPAVAYVLDTSPRMALQADSAEGHSRLAVAEAVLGEVLRGADPSLKMGLRVFGSGANAEGCKDTDLIVPFALSNQSQVADRLSTLKTGSSTDAALAEAMVAAIRELSQYKGPRYLVVVTGGVDSCNLDAGPLIAKEARQASIDLHTFVIGYQLDEVEAEAIKAMIAELAGAEYLSAPDPDVLQAVLGAIQDYINAPSEALRQAVALAATPGSQSTTTPEPHPTAAPGSQSTATPTPTVTPTSTVTPTPYVSQTACDHPYFPLRQGAMWQYSYSDLPSTDLTEFVVESVSGDLDSASVTISEKRNGAQFPTYAWSCTAEGVTYFQYRQYPLMPGFLATLLTCDSISNPTLKSEAINLMISNQSSAVLPTVADLEPGHSWSNSYKIQHSLQHKGEPGASAFGLTEVSATQTVGDQQTLDTALGTVVAIPIVANTNYAMTSLLGGRCNQLAVASSLTSTTYYVYGVGVVRIEMVSDSGSSTVELVKYSAP